MIKNINEKQWVWYYRYTHGLKRVLYIEKSKIKIYDDIIDINLDEVFDNEKDCILYSIAINYNRGWLRRHIEQNPNSIFVKELKESVLMFPEMYI